MGLVLVFCLWQRLAKSVCLSDRTKLSAEKMEDSVKAESVADGGGLVNAEKEPEDTLRYRNLGWSNFTSVLFLKMDGGWAVSGSERFILSSVCLSARVWAGYVSVLSDLVCLFFISEES